MSDSCVRFLQATIHCPAKVVCPHSLPRALMASAFGDSCIPLYGLWYWRDSIQFTLRASSNLSSVNSPRWFLTQETKNCGGNKPFLCGASLVCSLFAFCPVVSHWCLESFYVFSIQSRSHISLNITNSQLRKYMPTTQTICTHMWIEIQEICNTFMRKVKNISLWCARRNCCWIITFRRKNNRICAACV